jgi:hypothetical protein
MGRQLTAIASLGSRKFTPFNLNSGQRLSACAKVTPARATIQVVWSRRRRIFAGARPKPERTLDVIKGRMRRSHKISLPLVLVFLCAVLLAPGAQAQSPAAVTPDAGRVEGAKYTSSYFGFSYMIPETWAVRGTGGRVPGVGGYLLLSLKRKAGDALSSVMVSANELPAEYRNDIPRYLSDRYRLNQSVASGITINGIPAGRTRVRGGSQVEVLSLSDRIFYRLSFDTAGASRSAIATVEKEHILVFEVISPSTDRERSAQELVDSLYTLAFPDNAVVEKRQKR